LILFERAWYKFLFFAVFHFRFESILAWSFFGSPRVFTLVPSVLDSNLVRVNPSLPLFFCGQKVQMFTAHGDSPVTLPVLEVCMEAFHYPMLRPLLCVRFRTWRVPPKSCGFFFCDFVRAVVFLSALDVLPFRLPRPPAPEKSKNTIRPSPAPDIRCLRRLFVPSRLRNPGSLCPFAASPIFFR